MTLIERAVDALIEKTVGGDIPASVKLGTPTATSEGNVVYPPETPPSLTFTKPLAITLEGEPLPKSDLYRNPLLFRVIGLAAKKMEKKALQHAILVNQVEGVHLENGFHYIPEAELSVHGADSNNAWKATIYLIKAAALNVDVIFRWDTKEGAANSGQMTYMPA